MKPLNFEYTQCNIDFNISLMYLEILWRPFLFQQGIDNLSIWQRLQSYSTQNI